jgi:hypothetical protein
VASFRPSLPPAIHTDGLEKLAVRGWGRGGTTEQMMELERTVTPMLNRLATDERHLELVRNQCPDPSPSSCGCGWSGGGGFSGDLAHQPGRRRDDIHPALGG